ncbi:protein of unknown function [Methylocella tundrae]|uniref:Uncharacterized protein n=1 Tax=Methylocella tundrae TaxID=227605 RepID=A0A4U8Z4D1_METTU|nr:protein of unknown function [Methylocella tundrae]
MTRLWVFSPIFDRRHFHDAIIMNAREVGRLHRQVASEGRLGAAGARLILAAAWR